MDTFLGAAAFGEITLGVLAQWTRKCRRMGPISVLDGRRMWCGSWRYINAHGESGRATIVGVRVKGVMREVQ